MPGGSVGADTFVGGFAGATLPSSANVGAPVGSLLPFINVGCSDFCVCFDGSPVGSTRISGKGIGVDSSRVGDETIGGGVIRAIAGACVASGPDSRVDEKVGTALPSGCFVGSGSTGGSVATVPNSCVGTTLFSSSIGLLVGLGRLFTIVG